MRAVLEELGVPPAALNGPKGTWRGITWADRFPHAISHLGGKPGLCDVRGISLEGRPLKGRLPPELGSLREFQGLQKLALARIKGITGNISCLGNLTLLRTVYLADTAVYGDVGAFSQLSDLFVLVLSGTAVGGELASLRNMVTLSELELAGTAVTGDLRSLTVFQFPRLAWLDSW